MATVLPFRIAALAALVVISSAAKTPSIYNAVGPDRLEGGSSQVSGIPHAGQETSPDHAEAQYASLDGIGVITAFDTQDEYASQAMGTDDVDPVTGLASRAGNAALLALLDNRGGTQGGDRGRTSGGIYNAGQAYGAGHFAGGAQQQAFLQGNGGMSAPRKQGKGSSPTTGTHDANPLVGTPQADEDDGLDPYIYGNGKPHMNELIDPPERVVEQVADGDAPGSIPAVGCQSSGTCRALLSTPSNAVPEPGSLALLGLGMIGLALSRRRKAAIARQ